MEHAMRLAKEPFEALKAGQKVIESRLYDEKRKIISLGDVIAFSASDDPEATIRTRVTGLLRYSSFEKLFADHAPELFGGTSSAQLLDQIRQFYSDTDEAAYGVLGIRIEPID